MKERLGESVKDGTRIKTSDITQHLLTHARGVWLLCEPNSGRFNEYRYG